METIKNLLKPGGNVDDEILYGSGASTNPAHKGNTGTLSGEGSHLASAQATGPTSGEGSHFSSAKGATSGVGATNVGDTPTTTGPHSSKPVNTLDPSVDSTVARNNDIGYGSTEGSSMPGGFPADDEAQNTYSSKATDPTLSHTEHTSNTGPHKSNLLNKLDPRVKDDHPNAASETVSTGHQYGQDAAALGGATAVGEGIRHHRQGEPENLTSNSGYPATNQAGSVVSGPHSTDTANRLDPSVNTSGARIDDVHSHHDKTGGGAEQADLAHGESSKHHYGRDAAGVGAVGLGAHELSKHHKERELEKDGYSSTAGSANVPSNISSTQAARDKEHHHDKQAAGFGATAVGAHELSKHHDEKALEKDQVPRSDLGHPIDSTQVHTVDDKDHHYGRDATAVGAAGVGAHKLSKHHKDEELKKNEDIGATGSTVPKTGANTENDTILVGPVHKSSLLNKLDPRVKEVSRESATATNSGNLPQDTTGASQDHHYGRDAAGVGAVGVGAHELSKHHKEKEFEKEHGEVNTGISAGGVGDNTALSEHEKLKREVALNQKGNHYGQDMPGYTHSASGTQDTNQDHHGRDAAGLGVVGAGAYQAEKHHAHDKDLTTAEKEHKHEVKEEKKSGGLLGFLHRDKNKKYTKEEEDEFDRQEREHNSHKGRDVAVGAGAAGVGAHELNKHHKERELEKAQGSSSVPSQTNTHTHHGHDAAGTGALAAGSYEAEKHHHNSQHAETDTMKPLPTAPGGSSIGTDQETPITSVMDRKRGEGYSDPVGDHLHGQARNRGVDDATGNIAGTSQLAGGNDVTGSGSPSHLERDAALGTGAGAYEYENSKRDGFSGTDSTTYSTSGNYTTATGPSTYNNPTSEYGSTGQTESHVPRDATLGAGAGGLGHTVSTSGGHNKLHKNPPASHPAAQAE